MADFSFPVDLYICRGGNENKNEFLCCFFKADYLIIPCVPTFLKDLLYNHLHAVYFPTGHFLSLIIQDLGLRCSFVALHPVSDNHKL